MKKTMPFFMISILLNLVIINFFIYLSYLLPKEDAIIPIDKIKHKVLTNGSNITDGEYGSVFEDSSGTLWSMGYYSKLQYYDKALSSWQDDNTSDDSLKTYGSNIDEGAGLIFEDNTETLWTAGAGGTLQYLKKGASSWLSDTSSGLTKGSNINDGYCGFMFQDSSGTLWSMGAGTALQYFDTKTSSWEDSITDASLKTYNSNITDGNGAIFQDSSGTLWSMGNGTALQYFDTKTSSWEHSTSDANSKTYNSNINDGYGGLIFQDSSGTLWSMARTKSLQYWDADAQIWKHNTTSGLTNGSNIIDGTAGSILESNNSDGTKTLWTMGNGSKLQYWDADSRIWKHDTTSGLTNGSNITNGYEGTIFQDSSGTLWSMGDGTALQYYSISQQKWISAVQ